MKIWTAILTASALTCLALPSTARAEESNRNEVRANIAKDGWRVVWGITLNEAEYVECIATFVAGKPELYFNSLLQRNINKFAKNAPGIAADAVRDAVIESLRNRGRTIRLGQLEVDGGIATYQRWVHVSFHNPIDGRLIRHKQELPNHHTPYVRFRLIKDNGNTENAGGGAAAEAVEHEFRINQGEVEHRVPG